MTSPTEPDTQDAPGTADGTSAPNPATLAQAANLFRTQATTDDKGDEDASTDDGAASTDDIDPDESKSAEELRAELAALRKAQRKANREAEKWRKQVTGKNGDKPEAKSDKADDADGVAEDVLAEIKSQTASEVEGKYRPLIIRTAATSALTSAGLALPSDGDKRKARLDRVMKLLDTDDLTVSEDGTVDGLDDAIDDLKDSFPEFFAPQGKTVKAASIGASPKSGTPERAKSATELQAEAFFGGGS